MGEWPSRIRSASSAWSTLSALWVAIAEGGLRPPADDAIEARLLFGTAISTLVDDDEGGWIPHGGPSWSREWTPPRFLLGSFSRRDPPPTDPVPSCLFRVPIAAQLTGGRAVVGEYAATILASIDSIPPMSAAAGLWDAPVARNAPRAPERGRVGVVPPPYDPTPAGTYAAALAALTGRALVDEIESYAATRPAREATAFRREIAEIVEFADAVESYLDGSSASWLVKANEWISTEATRAAGHQIVPASLRANGRN